VEVNDVGDLIYNYEAFAKVLGWRYNSESDCWIKDGIKFRHMYWSIFEVFDQGEYNALNANGKTVVDVGAYVGDSSIYFALRGAKRVIAIEPHPTAFKEMLDNIRLNNLEYVIVPINAGLASKQGKICIGETDVSRTAGLYYRSDKYGGEIPAITLSELIKKYGVGYDAVLKMDCEGCEYDIILNDYQSVKIFNELIFEYHTDTTSEPVSRLLKVLARDYCYKIVKRRKGFGIVHCVRR
jgi:FkbM family methyltransferase